ncbi:serine hydrolase, partial [Patescibacteria group bacterium]|nr:serine hydrolase [Patescibacteria group bacterium]
ESIAVGGAEIHRTGCVANFFGLLSLVDYLETNGEDPAPYEADITQGVSGSLPWRVAGFLTKAYGSTDAGVAVGNGIVSELGLVSTVYGNIPGYPADDDSPNYKFNQITASDTNLALEKLWKGEIFDSHWTEYTLERMREIANWGLRYIIPGQVPLSATVAHKIGYFPDDDGWVQNNIGIVTFTGTDGEEKAYAISFLSEKSQTEYGAAFFGAHLSKLVWDYFAQKY